MDVVDSVASRRKDDGAKYRNWFRSDRMFEDSGNWFFYTREGTIEGPYDSREKADIALVSYIAAVTSGQEILRAIA